MNKTISELLENFGITYLAIQGSTDDVDLIEKEQEKLINQTATRILELFEKCVPEEKMFELQRGGDMQYSIKIFYPDGNYIQSTFMDITRLVSYIYNQALAEIKQRIEGER